MDKFPKDVLVLLAIDLDLPDILRFCKAYPNVDENICNNKHFWIRKLNKDFNKEKDDFKYLKLSPRKLYELLYSLKLVVFVVQIDHPE